MTELADRIYGFMRRHKVFCALSVIVATALLALQASRLSYKEDITDFLPLDEDYRNAMRVYEEISGGDRVIAIFQLADTTDGDADDMTTAIDDFAYLLEESDTTGLIKDIICRADASQIEEVEEFVYANAPYFMTEADYARIDSLMADSDFATKAIKSCKSRMFLPMGEMAAIAIRDDPAGLFSPIMSRLDQTDSELSYEMYDGHIFSPDMSRGIAIATSAAGAMESDRNGLLAALTQTCADSVMARNPKVSVHITGGPVIAAGNSGQIKRDCVMSVAISAVFILLLLFVAFGGVRDMALIGVSIAWGWLFAVGGMSLLRDEMSMIVLGISSVIIGIAVNYPLHYLSHLRHTPNRRTALREIVSPLVVGNVTTVGAFLALVPLNSAALRDLGLFASLMLAGTILFVIMYLPHAAKARALSRHNFIDRLCEKTPENKPAILWGIAALTLLFGYFSLETTFDTDMGSINYMTEQQEADIEYFESQLSRTGPERKIYAIVTDTTADLALAKNEALRSALADLAKGHKASRISYCGDFLCPREEQERRLRMWADFKASKWEIIKSEIARAAEAEGFTDDAFEPFFALGDKQFAAQDVDAFATLRESVFSLNVSRQADGACSIVSIMDVEEKDYDEVKTRLAEAGAYAFDVKGMNGAVAERLSDDFNYIGWACGLIVFVFLWLSLGSIELAIISFLPMAVSWVWILGILGILGIKFNIVNVILATFIFGQGDDYTIFMTEGASYEYTYRRKMLASYKSSIILSALIMFVGIGTLIVARHPALRSLAEVTIAGMTSVVLMAYILPPLLFKSLVSRNGLNRRRPISLLPLLNGAAYRLTGRTACVRVEICPDSPCKGTSGPCVMACIMESNDLVGKILRGCNKRIGGGDIIVQGPDEALRTSATLNLPLRPLSVWGMSEIAEKGNPCLYSGIVALRMGDEVSAKSTSIEQLKTLCKANDIANARQSSTPEHFADLVTDRYRYKENGIHRAVRSYVKSGKAMERAMACIDGDGVTDADEDYGASALMAALSRPGMHITVHADSDDRAEIIRCCADGIAPNLEVRIKG